MFKTEDYNVFFKIKGSWIQQPQILKARFGQLTLSDLKFEVGKEANLLTWIGIRLNKRCQEVIHILKHL